MADVNVTDLTQETYSTLDGTEQVIMFDSAEGKRATVAAVGEYVLKKLTTSLNGSTQTVANALSSLNSDLQTITDIGTDATDLNTEYEVAKFSVCKAGRTTANTPYSEGLTGNGTDAIIMSMCPTANYGLQVAWISGSNMICFRRRAAGTWNEWKIVWSV